ncbi:MAG: hypothetical protein IJK60_05580 [Clostridia bacterium]|nr:hypothetical protein [Clostridia bacterium]
MKLTNGEITVELTAPGTIDAYLSEGWTEVVPEEKPKPEKKPAKSKQ